MLHAVDRGSGTPIVWIHGFPLSSAIFEPQFAIPDVRHVAPDLPGFGATPPPIADLIVDDYADAVAELIRAKGIERSVIAGVSMGGYVLFAMLRRHAALVRGAILIDTRETADSAEARAGRQTAAASARESGTAEIVAQMFPKMLTPETIAMADWRSSMVMQSMENATVPGVLAALAAMAARPDSTATIRESDIPLIALVGERDAITPPADAERMVSLAKDGMLAVVPDAAHLSNVERPADVNRFIQAFLTRLR